MLSAYSLLVVTEKSVNFYLNQIVLPVICVEMNQITSRLKNVESICYKVVLIQ